MEIGIFANIFERPTLDATLDAVTAHGLGAVQFNLASAGLPSMPDAIDPALADRIRDATATRGIAVAALSGTFNMIHPDPAERAAGLRRLRVLAAACARIGTATITLCTGTRDPDEMWRRHPENGSPAAWRDLLTTMTTAVAIAEEHDLTLAFEPERVNVVDTAAKAKRLLDEIGSPRLAVVLDPANLFDPPDAARLPDLLAAAIDLLGDRIVLAHAKDRDAAGVVRPAGLGIVPWGRFLALLRAAGYDGPLILHGLAEPEVAAAVAFLGAALGTTDGGRSPDRSSSS